jgi:hypothetical protein
VKQLSASEAARRFSVAGTGRALKMALRENAPDPDWAAELRQLRESVGPGTNPSHDD